MNRETELLLGAVFSYLLNGEERECKKLLLTLVPSELHELRNLASQLRGLTVDVASKNRKEWQ